MAKEIKRLGLVGNTVAKSLKMNLGNKDHNKMMAQIAKVLNDAELIPSKCYVVMTEVFDDATFDLKENKILEDVDWDKG